MSDSSTTLIKNLLDNTVFSLLQGIAPGIPATTLKQITNNVSEEYSQNIVRNVDLSTTFNLNNIPKNLEGGVNPVNITNSNNGVADIFDNLQIFTQEEYHDDLVNNVALSILNQLKTNLTPGQFNNLNLDNLSASLPNLLSPSITQSLNISLNNSLDTIFNTSQLIPPTLPSVSKLFEILESDEALEQIDQEFLSSTASLALEEADQFELDFPDNTEKLKVLTEGFTDPSATYPTKEYAGISETNKLATGDIKGTVVQKKNDSKMLGAKLPYGESWDQPESPYRGQYPYNKVTQTEQGHIIEVDDTPGSERLHVYHRSGTFIEIDANGSVVKRCKGSSYEIIDRNGKISIAGKADISINGACNIFVGNDANIEVEGDINLTCHNDITAQAGGKFNLSAVEEFNITSKKIFMEAYETMDIKSKDYLNIFSSNKFHIKSTTDMYVQANDYYHKTVNHYIQGENLYHKHDNVYLEASSDIHIQGSSFNVDADPIHLNSGTSTSSKDSKQANVALSSNIGIMQGRKDIFDNSIPDPSFLTLADNKSLLLEEEYQTTSDYEKQKTVLISSGYASSSEIDSSPVVVESETPSSAQTLTVSPDEALLKATTLPGNYNLSPNFTVEQLSNKAAVTKDIIRGHGNLSYGEIVYNLQNVALNILEPIKKVYPNMFVTSAFRDPGNSSNSSTSQHPRGQAVDIQFKGANKEDYYDLAVKIARIVKYDQLILEYCSYTKNPWIHISLSVKNNKNQVLTFFNHKKHSDGLSNLA